MSVQSLTPLELSSGKVSIQAEKPANNKPSFDSDIQASKAKARELSEGEQSSQSKGVLENMLKNIVEDLDKVDLSNSRISFSEDQDTGSTIIQVIDNNTEEVIRQIPPEEVLTLRKKIGEMLGLILDKKV